VRVPDIGTAGPGHGERRRVRRSGRRRSSWKSSVPPGPKTRPGWRKPSRRG